MKKDFCYLLLVFSALILSIQGCKNDNAAQNSKAQPSNETATNQKEESLGSATIIINNLTWQTKNRNVELPGSWCYDDIPSYCNTYGRLYSLDAAIEACATLGPEWRVPTYEEWEAMIALYGGMHMTSLDQEETAFSKLLEGGTVGFNAIRAGARVVGGHFADLGDQAYFWTSTHTPYYADDVFTVIVFQNSTQAIANINFSKSQGASCRCVKEN